MSWELQEALDAALSGDAQLSALMGNRWYSLMAPDGAPFPRGIFGSSGTVRGGTLRRSGKRNEETLSVYTRAAPGEKVNKEQALRIAAHVERILDRQPLSLAGQTVGTGRVQLLSCDLDASDPNRRTVRALLLYSLATLVSA